jgi:hypothetical protein
LKFAMEQQGIADVQVFHDWLEAEFKALSSLSQLPSKPGSMYYFIFPIC